MKLVSSGRNSISKQLKQLCYLERKILLSVAKQQVTLSDLSSRSLLTHNDIRAFAAIAIGWSNGTFELVVGVAAKNFALLGGAVRSAFGLALFLPVVGGAAVGFWQSTPRGAVALTNRLNP